MSEQEEQKIKGQLIELFNLNPSKSFIVERYGRKGSGIRGHQNRYELFISETPGGLDDITRVHKILENAGLVEKSQNPQYDGVHRIVIAGNKFAVGATTSNGEDNYFKGKPIIDDELKLSGNTLVRAKANDGFYFEIKFAGENKAIINGLNLALQQSKAELDKNYEAIAAEIPTGRTKQQDEEIVKNYIEQQVKKQFKKSGDIKVEIIPPGTDSNNRWVINILSEDAHFNHRNPYNHESFILRHNINYALREKLPLVHPDYIGINGHTKTQGEGTKEVFRFHGSISGSAAKLAAEITGELQKYMATKQTPDGSVNSIKSMSSPPIGIAPGFVNR